MNSNSSKTNQNNTPVNTNNICAYSGLLSTQAYMEIYNRESTIDKEDRELIKEYSETKANDREKFKDI